MVRTGCVGVWGSNWDGRGKEKTLSTIRPKFSTFRVIHRVGIELWEKMHFHSGVPPTIYTREAVAARIGRNISLSLFSNIFLLLFVRFLYCAVAQ